MCICHLIFFMWVFHFSTPGFSAPLESWSLPQRCLAWCWPFRVRRSVGVLQETEADKLCRKLELKDHVPCQMQRLTKYPMLIENLMKYTQSSKCSLSVLIHPASKTSFQSTQSWSCTASSASSLLVTDPSQNRPQTMCHNSFSVSSPAYFSDLLTVYTPSRQLCSSADNGYLLCDRVLLFLLDTQGVRFCQTWLNRGGEVSLSCRAQD